jgi:hypothetical protein
MPDNSQQFISRPMQTHTSCIYSSCVPCLRPAISARLIARSSPARTSHLCAQYPAKPNTPIAMACPPMSVRSQNNVSSERKQNRVYPCGRQRQRASRVSLRTVEEVTLLDTELAEAGSEAEEREAGDASEKTHGICGVCPMSSSGVG